MDADGAQTALDAMRAAWDLEPVQTGMGGSIPFIADLKQTFPAGTDPGHRRRRPTPAPTAPTSPSHIPDFRNAILAEHCCLAHSAPAKSTRKSGEKGHQTPTPTFSGILKAELP